jgi:uncharacterized repeat protein (TIGR03843 family)
MQLYVEADPNEHFFTLRDARLDDFASVALFDAIANNADRKSGHCLVDGQGTIWSIDHGVCFAAAPKLRSVIWEFAGERIPPELLDDVRRVAGGLRSGAVRDRMARLLDLAEVDAAADRAEDLVRSKRFPEPASERPFPWPPV